MSINNIKDRKFSFSNNFNKQALFDLVLIMTVLVAVKQLVLPFSFLLAGPASTFSAMIVGTWLLWRRGLSWGDLGLRRPKNIIKTLALTAVSFLTIVVVASLMGWVTGFFFESVADSGRFAHVEGNITAFLLIIFLVWTHGSFFEELLFRAFMINRASAFLGGGLKADIVAALFSAVFFGYRHYYYQGIKGALVTGSIGFGLALLYLWFGRKNILPLILSHGLINTISQVQRFLGVEDG